MLPDYILWPTHTLKPSAIDPNPVPFSRSGGRTVGGISTDTRTDRGYWSIAFKGISLVDGDRRRLWNSIRVGLSGKAGLLAVPVWSYDTAPWPAGTVNGQLLTIHADGTPHSDGTAYAQSAIGVELVEAVGIGATIVKLRALYGIEELSGIRFSYQHALYVTGFPLSIDGDIWQVLITPAVRAPIPAGAELEVGLPTCLVHLASDDAMDVRLSAGDYDSVDVAFIEAVDYWNELADA